MTKHQCPGCGEVLDDHEIVPFEEIEDLHERISPGETVPSGECPQCGALTQAVEAKEANRLAGEAMNMPLYTISQRTEPTCGRDDCDPSENPEHWVDVELEPVAAAAPELLEAAKAMDALMDNLGRVVPWGLTSDLLDLEALSTVPLALKRAIANTERGRNNNAKVSNKGERMKADKRTKALLKGFPGMGLNECCLENFACPKCGGRDRFRITGTIIATMFDNGTDRDDSDFEYDGGSPCVCDKCDHSGTVRDFKFPGLDNLIREVGEKSKSKRS